MHAPAPIPPSDFDWVTARAECSAAALFQALQQQARKNVTDRNESVALEYRSPGQNRFFFKDPGSRHFRVLDSWGPPDRRRSVDFILDENAGVVVVEPSGLQAARFTATPALTETGECRSRVDGGAELDRWQVLRHALEELFFANAESV